MQAPLNNGCGEPQIGAMASRVSLAEAILRRHHRWGEWLLERGIFAVSLSAILMIFLIFVFVGREAVPVALGWTNNARIQKPIAAADIPKLAPEKLAAYLGVKPDELKTYDADTLRQLVDLMGQ